MSFLMVEVGDLTEEEKEWTMWGSKRKKIMTDFKGCSFTRGCITDQKIIKNSLSSGKEIS